MLKIFGLLLVASLAASPAAAQLIQAGGGPVTATAMPADDDQAEIDRAVDAAIANAQALGLKATRRVRRTGNLDFPLRLRPNSRAYRSSGISNFVDLDPGPGTRDFACGHRTYDGHNGDDFMLYPFPWRIMDAGAIEIVAAAPGVIVNKFDGAYDRRCSFGKGTSVRANFVVVRQHDGLLALYWHMKRGSVTTKAVGQSVRAGEVLGLVGSSGHSTGPHLHFGLLDSNRKPVDPWQGACGTSPRTHWRHQPETIDTDFMRIATHSAPVNLGSTSCDNPNPHYADVFAPGAAVSGAVYLRDQVGALRIWFVRPDGSVYFTASTPAQQNFLAYWWWRVTLPGSSANGVWKLRAKIGPKLAEHAFIVGTAPGPTRLKLTRRPPKKTIPAGAAGRFIVTVENIGRRNAVGCNLGVDAPLAANWTVREIGKPASETNHVFNVPKGASRRLRLSIKPKSGYKANNMTVPLRVTCLNANSPVSAVSNRIKLTF